MKKILLLPFILLTAICCRAQTSSNKADEGIKPVGIIKNLTDSALLDVVQRQTFRYFWDYGHPVSGLARERSNKSYDYGDEVVTTGGSGFGIMAMVAGVSRQFISRADGLARLQKIVAFLKTAQTNE